MNGTALLVSIPEGARLLGISRSHAYNLVAGGRLHPIRIGRSVRLRVAELEALIAELAGGAA